LDNLSGLKLPKDYKYETSDIVDPFAQLRKNIGDNDEITPPNSTYRDLDTMKTRSNTLKSKHMTSLHGVKILIPTPAQE
jgi:hypothetical protein